MAWFTSVLIGEADLDACPVSAAMDGSAPSIRPSAADRLHPVEIVGIADLGRDDDCPIRLVVARDRPVEMPETLEARASASVPAADVADDGLALRHQACRRGQQAGALHLPADN